MTQRPLTLFTGLMICKACIMIHCKVCIMIHCKICIMIHCTVCSMIHCTVYIMIHCKVCIMIHCKVCNLMQSDTDFVYRLEDCKVTVMISAKVILTLFTDFMNCKATAMKQRQLWFCLQTWWTGQQLLWRKGNTNFVYRHDELQERCHDTKAKLTLFIYLTSYKAFMEQRQQGLSSDLTNCRVGVNDAKADFVYRLD